MIASMNFDIVIIGGGLLGASMAAGLKHSGLSIAVIESQNAPISPDIPETENQWDSRLYAISPGSSQFLEQCGAWSRIDPWRITPVEAMRVFGDTGPELKFTAQQIGHSELAFIIENRAMHRALWDILREQHNVTLLEQSRCATLDFNPDHAELTLENGQKIKAKLVVGADGRNSWARNQAGISAAPIDYHQHGVVANFITEQPHQNIAYEWFQTDGILAFLPLSGSRVSMVWTATPEKSAELLALDSDALSRTVEAASFNTLGKLELITPAAAFPLRLLILPTISKPRLALIGDAAHNMHPLAGQGANTGFRDVQQLIQLLMNRGLQDDCGDAHLLRQYDRKRKEDIYSGQAVTYGLKHLFNNDVSVIRELRNWGLGVTNKITPVKKLLISHAVH